MLVKFFNKVIDISKRLNDLRQEINSLDNTIFSLLEQRAKVVKEVGELKKGTKTRVYVPEREAEIFDRLASQSTILSKDMIKSIFTEIISACRSLEGILKVAILVDSSSEIALRNILGNFVESVPFTSMEELKKNIENFNYILLPSNNETNDFLKNSDAFIIANENKVKENVFLLLERSKS